MLSKQIEQVRFDPGCLDGLGGGAQLGNRVHDLLEQVIGNGRELEDLLGHKEDVESQILLEKIPTILSAPLTIPGSQKTTCLSGLRPKVMAEMHFMLPLGSQPLSPEILSKALLEDRNVRENQRIKEWAEGVSEWDFDRLRGYLQGFIDLVFEHEGRWWILDYKTNQLPGYGKNEMEQAMIECDYLLQARLYAVALHRHLEVNLCDYDPSSHFGGCAYMFLRGCPNEGLWTETPSPEGMTALCKLFGGNC